jgi:hypothetical protein
MEYQSREGYIEKKIDLSFSIKANGYLFITSVIDCFVFEREALSCIPHAQ